jgi:hypothetical protein
MAPVTLPHKQHWHGNHTASWPGNPTCAGIFTGSFLALRQAAGRRHSENPLANL